jgi:hypothetical protein
MTEDTEKRFWAGGLDKISWEVGFQEGIEAERNRILETLRELRELAQKDRRLTTNVNISAIIKLVKEGVRDEN